MTIVARSAEMAMPPAAAALLHRSKKRYEMQERGPNRPKTRALARVLGLGPAQVPFQDDYVARAAAAGMAIFAEGRLKFIVPF